MRFLVLLQGELEPEPELELVSKRTQMQVVVVFGFEAWRRGRRLEACWCFLRVQFSFFFALLT